MQYQSPSRGERRVPTGRRRQPGAGCQSPSEVRQPLMLADGLEQAVGAQVW